MAAEQKLQIGSQTNGTYDTLEKDFEHSRNSDTTAGGYNNGNTYNNGSPYHLNDPDMDNEAALKRIRTAGSISISPELFEKIYLSPQNAVKGDLRKTFGNPTPVALVGFLLALSPRACDLMGWRGAGGSGAASTGVYFFFGGLLMVLGGFLEFILGNTFPFVVFTSFGAFWLSFGATLQPTFNAFGAYAPADAKSIAEGLTTKGFNASFAFFMLFMGVLCFIYLICSLRTNVAFVIIFLSLVVGFSLLAATYFHAAQGNAAIAARTLVGGGAAFFVTILAGWWIFFAIMLAALDFPFQIPVGDLSTLIKAGSVRTKEKENMV